MWKPLGAIALAVFLATAGTASAQMKDKTPAKVRSAASLECSKQADEKGLHGKARKKFRKKCMKDVKDKGLKQATPWKENKDQVGSQRYWEGRPSALNAPAILAPGPRIENAGRRRINI
jgi:hypothetical protein